MALRERGLISVSLGDLMRWIWIDRFLSFERGKKARALKNLSLAEDYFQQHLPGYPIMPACFILEGLAQTGGILVGEANDFKEKVVLAKITSARFQREAVAGETLMYETEILTLRPEGTAGCVRAVIQHNLIAQQPQRLYYLGQMFRHERPQKGRYRQFHQVGAEAYGMAGPDIDAELICLTARLWRQLGLDAVTLQINSLGSSTARAACCPASSALTT